MKVFCVDQTQNATLLMPACINSVPNIENCPSIYLTEKAMSPATYLFIETGDGRVFPYLIKNFYQMGPVIDLKLSNFQYIINISYDFCQKISYI